LGIEKFRKAYPRFNNTIDQYPRSEGLFDFLSKGENIQKMISESDQGRPALQGAVTDLEKNFEDLLKLEEDKHSIHTMVGTMIKFLLAPGYEPIPGGGKPIKCQYFKNATVYRKSYINYAGEHTSLPKNGTLLEQERKRIEVYKQTSPYFSQAAKEDGIYRGRQRKFCLHNDYADENLFYEIREHALTYFMDEKIRWHDGKKRYPSNHLCDSQVCCANFLFPFAYNSEALVTLLRQVYPSIKKALPMEEKHPHQFVSFEWIGLKNYLKEKSHIKGANSTSADAAVMFERQDGARQIVLIEWKYTESYQAHSIKFSRSGTDRSIIYAPLFKRDNCPLDKTVVKCFDDLFYEPFYQLMRLQFLANEMEMAGELGADIVSLLLIVPAHNTAFQKVTSPNLRKGLSVGELWQSFVVKKDRFKQVSTESFFDSPGISENSNLASWRQYIKSRYAWVNK
jgi:hypothetical protein